MADLASFEHKFMRKLEHNRIVSVSAIVDLRKEYGLTEEQVDTILEQAVTYGIGFADVVFIYAKKIDAVAICSFQP